MKETLVILQKIKEELASHYDLADSYNDYPEAAKNNAGIGFDFDSVLSTLRGQTIARQTSAEVYIVTARSATNLGGYYGTAEVYKIADKLNIPHSNVFFEGSNQRKIARVKELGLSTFYDNNPQVIAKLPSIGKLF